MHISIYLIFHIFVLCNLPCTDKHSHLMNAIVWSRCFSVTYNTTSIFYINVKNGNYVFLDFNIVILYFH